MTALQSVWRVFQPYAPRQSLGPVQSLRDDQGRGGLPAVTLGLHPLEQKEITLLSNNVDKPLRRPGRAGLEHNLS